MSNYTQASINDVYAAGVVRGAEFGAALVKELGRRVPNKNMVRDIEARIIDLRRGLEEAALESRPAQRDVILGYLQSTYGLVPAALDPLLRPLLPPLSPNGNMLVPVVLSVNGFNLVVNNRYIRRGYVIVPNTAAPIYNKTLTPFNPTYGAYTYNGMADTELSFDPATGVAALPFTVFLYVGGQQVGRVDYPPVAAGTGFSLLHNGTLYYGTFPSTTNQNLTL